MSVPANFNDTYDVVASPADGDETVVALLGGVGELLPGLGVNLHGWVDLTLDADATSVIVAVRRNSLAGDQVGPSATLGPFAAAAFGEVQVPIDVVDFPGSFAGAVYVLTVVADQATGPSTVNGVHLGSRVC